jgi:hypothetical protein
MIGMLCACAKADDLGLTRLHDPWGRYDPGAWVLVRVRTEAYNEGGTFESVTETKTTLTEVGEEGVTLKMEVGAKIGGKEIETTPQAVSKRFHGELTASEPQISDLGEGEVLIENRQIPCRIRKLEYPRPGGRKVAVVYYSDTVEPYILRQETALYAEDTENPTSETTMQVVSLSAPCRVWRNFRMASRVKSVRKDASGTTTTWTWVSSLVPGGVICYTSQQVDNEGRLVCYRELQMLDYGLQKSSGRSGLFWRMRSRRGK